MANVFLALSKTIDLLLSPLTWVLLLLLLALLSRRRRGLADAAVGFALACLLAFSSQPVAQRLMRHTEASASQTFRPGVTYDAVILLGGAVDAEPSRAAGSPQFNAAADRVIRTAKLLRSGQARDVLISGGAIEPQPGEPSEAERTGLLLRDWGISPDRIYLETRSRNTRENAVESARVVAARGWRTLLLVTSAAHMPRALGCFRVAGLAPDTLPVDYRAGDGRGQSWLPRAEFLEMSTAALRELAGRLVYWVVGYSRS